MLLEWQNNKKENEPSKSGSEMKETLMWPRHKKCSTINLDYGSSLFIDYL